MPPRSGCTGTQSGASWLSACLAGIQWAREIEKFSGHQAPGGAGARRTRWIVTGAPEGFVIVNYELIFASVDHQRDVQPGSGDAG